MSRLQVDLALIQKYNVPGPRYTSYPPATRFTEQMTWPDLAEEILRNNQGQRDLSLYFHIPFCETLCWFCGCTTVITLQHSQGTTYVEYLKKELVQMCTMLNPRRKVAQLHFGGGSPTFLTPNEIRTLGTAIHEHFAFAPEIEAGVEIDPRRLTQDHLVALRGIGFNRASLGVQDFDPQVMQAVHRIQPQEMTERVIGWIREAGFKSLNVDLIYGLPHQTLQTFERTLDRIIKLGPDRLAVFNYAHVPWIKPSQKIFEKRAVLPAPETKLQLIKLVTEKLTGEGGYVYIGMDHFARPTDELAVAQRNKTLQRNFQGYSTHGDADIYAFGMSSISQTENAYWQSHKDLPTYYGALDSGKAPLHKGYFVTEDDKIRRETIMQVMCNLGLNYASMSQRLGINFAAYFARELESLADMQADGLVRCDGEGLHITDLGRLLIRNIAMRFDVYLPRETERRFSRTI